MDKRRLELLRKLYQLLLLDRVDEPKEGSLGISRNDSVHGLWGHSHERFCIWRRIQPRKRAIATTYFAVKAIWHLYRHTGDAVPERLTNSIRKSVEDFKTSGLSFRHAAFVTWLYHELGLNTPALLPEGFELPLAHTDESWHVGAIAAAMRWHAEGGKAEEAVLQDQGRRLREALQAEMRQPGMIEAKLAVHSWLGARDLVARCFEMPMLESSVIELARTEGDVAMCCGVLAAAPDNDDLWNRLSDADLAYDGYTDYFSSYSAHLFLQLRMTADEARNVLQAGAHLIEGRPEPQNLLVGRELVDALGKDAARAALRRGEFQVPRTVLVVGNQQEVMGQHAERETKNRWTHCGNIRPRFLSDQGFAGSPRFRRDLGRLLSDETMNVAAIVSVQPSRDARSMRDFLDEHNIPSLLFLVVASRDDLLDRQPLRSADQTPVRVIRLPNNRQQALAINEALGGASRILIVLENLEDGYVEDLAHALHTICPATDQRFDYVTLVGTQFMEVELSRSGPAQRPTWRQVHKSAYSTTHLTDVTLVYIGYPRGLTRLMTLWNRNQPSKIIASDGCSGVAFQHAVIAISVEAKLAEQVGDLLDALNAVEGAHRANERSLRAPGLSPSSLGRRVMRWLESNADLNGKYAFRKNENTTTAYTQKACPRTGSTASLIDTAKPYFDWAFIARTSGAPVSDAEWPSQLRLAYDNVASLLEDTPVGVAPNAECVVLFHNTTSALQRLLISLSRDAREDGLGSVLTTDVEYAGTYFALRDNWRERVYIVPVADLLMRDGTFDEETLRRRFRRAFAIAKPKVVLMSHVERATGLVLPVRKLVADFELMAPRRDEFFVVIDGAQGVGNIQMNDVTTAIDFYVGCTHKWLGGEPTLGFLYSRNPQFDMRDPAQSYYLGATTGGAGNLKALASFNQVYERWRNVPHSHPAEKFVNNLNPRSLGLAVVGRGWNAEQRSSIVAFRTSTRTVAAVEERLRKAGYEVTLIGEHAFYEFGPNLPTEFIVLHSLEDDDDAVEPVRLSEGFVNPHPSDGYLRLCIHPRQAITDEEVRQFLETCLE